MARKPREPRRKSGKGGSGSANPPDPPESTEQVSASSAPPAHVAPVVVLRAHTGGRTWSASDDEEHGAFIGKALTGGLTRGIIRQAFTEKFKAPKSRFVEVWEAIERGVIEDFEATRPKAKALQASRLEAYLGTLRQEKRWTVITRVEALLADIYGTREATQVQLSGSVTTNGAHILATMTPERYAEMLAAARERHALAEEAIVMKNAFALNKPTNGKG